MFRNFWAILAGIVTAAVLYTLVREAGEMVFPAPPELSSSDLESMRHYLSQLPLGAILFIIAKPTIAALMGTLVACYIGASNSTMYGMVVGGVVLTYAISYFIAVPHPLWLSLAALIGVVISTYLAVQLAPGPGAQALETDDRDSDSG